MKVVVGSQNPVKINATLKAFREYFSDVQVTGVKTNSGVSDQPMNPDESYAGAKRRAELALRQSEADFGVGIEGGIEEHSFGAFTSGWVVIINAKGEMGIGTSGRLLVPANVIKTIKEEKSEIGVVVGKLVRKEDMKHQGGMTAAFTQGKMNREESYCKAVIYALTRFVSAQYFK